MILTKSRLRAIPFALAIVFVLGLMSGCSHAQPTMAPQNFAQRHSTLTSAAAGYAAYKIAKTTGHNRDMNGNHKNFAQRHPFLTGAAAAAVTHHVIKHGMP